MFMTIEIIKHIYQNPKYNMKTLENANKHCTRLNENVY